MAMAKNRRLISSSIRRRFKQFVVLVLVSFSLFSMLSHIRSQFGPKPKTVTAIDERSFGGNPKVAFLFLVRENLPLDFLWHSFFENGDSGNFSIYIHSKPGFVFDESATKSAVFHGRQLEHSVLVAWGKPSMIEAEKLLLTAALDDPSNQRFVLLSDSCVPLYNFTYIYNYLMSSPKSFVDSFLDTKDHRYNPEMLPVIQEDKWRKGSQVLDCGSL